MPLFLLPLPSMLHSLLLNVQMGSASGAAYAFVSRDNKAKLVLSGKMLPSDGAAGDFFGFSIAMDQTDDNGRVLVGADLKGSDMSGAA